MKEKICIVGGDMRQITLAELLRKDGFEVTCAAVSDEKFSPYVLRDTDVLILPIPVSRDEIYINTPMSKERIAIDEVLSAVQPKCLVLGACISDNLQKKLTARGLEFEDYYEREELIIKNAVPTAEGALEIAIAELPITIFASRCLVVGCGKVGKATAQRFRALGSDVTVSARKLSDFAKIESNGMRYIHTNDLALHAGEFDVIVNTVPAEVLTYETLKNVKTGVLIIDLASKPGGVDLEAAKTLRVNVIWALSLPGKCAPMTSGKIITESIENILAQREV